MSLSQNHQLFVCLFGLWAGFRSLTDSPECLSIERPRWGLRGPALRASRVSQWVQLYNLHACEAQVAFTLYLLVYIVKLQP